MPIVNTITYTNQCPLHIKIPLQKFLGTDNFLEDVHPGIDVQKAIAQPDRPYDLPIGEILVQIIIHHCLLATLSSM